MHLLYKIQHIRALYYSFIQNKIIHAKKLYVFKYVNALKINEFYYFLYFKYFAIYMKLRLVIAIVLLISTHRTNKLFSEKQYANYE